MVATTAVGSSAKFAMKLFRSLRFPHASSPVTNELFRKWPAISQSEICRLGVWR